MLNVLRGFVLLILSIFIYLFYETISLPWFNDVSFSIWTYSLQLIVVYGAGSFLCVFFPVLLMSKKYRIILAGLIMYMLLAFLTYNLIVSSYEFWVFTRSVIFLSINSLGAMLGVYFSVFLIGSKKSMSKKVKRVKSKKPKTPIFLLFLAILSIPSTYIVLVLSAFIVLGISSLLLLIVLSWPRIPFVLLFGLGLAPLMGLYVAFRAIGSMFKRDLKFEPSIILNMEKHSNLKEAIAEVCLKVKTKIPDAVILHAEPTFFVMQGSIQTFDEDVGGRILAIGAPLVNELDIFELKSILAHEFAHFSGKDTFYSVCVLPVYKAINSSLRDLESMNSGDGETSLVSNIVNLLLMVPKVFLIIFANYFGAIDNAISRSRELRADWISAKIYGNKNFESALKKVVKIGHHFYASFNENIKERKINFYAFYKNVLQESKSKLKEYEEVALQEEESELDSHPSLSTRISNLPDIGYERQNENQTNLSAEIAVDVSKLSDKMFDAIDAQREYNRKIEELLTEHKETIAEFENKLNNYEREMFSISLYFCTIAPELSNSKLQKQSYENIIERNDPIVKKAKDLLSDVKIEPNKIGLLKEFVFPPITSDMGDLGSEFKKRMNILLDVYDNVFPNREMMLLDDEEKQKFMSALIQRI